MSLYEYECKKCKAITDHFVSIHDDASKAKHCPACEKCGGKTKKIISTPYVIMKEKNVTIGELMDKGEIETKPPQWFDEQSRKGNKN